MFLVNSVGFSSNLCDIPFPSTSPGGKKVGISQKEFHLARKQKAIHLVNLEGSHLKQSTWRFRHQKFEATQQRSLT